MADTPLAALENGWVRPIGPRDQAEAFLRKLKGPARFACVIASTDTAEIEGISAAGETPYLRRFTAALDSEYLLYGKTLTLDDVPRNPLGPPSPVLISRAALELMGTTALIVDAGTRVPPRTPRLVAGGAPGESIVGGKALALSSDFSQAARAAARMALPQAGFLVLGESVPGGTTTALSVMEALNVRAMGKVSSSMPGGNHSLKEEVVRLALAEAKLPKDVSALLAAAAVGDPMQPLAALMALEASLHCPVVLGGGTQMAAVWALAARLLSEGEEGNPENICLATTKWVAQDPSADLAGLLSQASPVIPAFAAWLDFSGCRSMGLRHYEEGLVKEGVGAGAAAFSALTTGSATMDELVNAIDLLAEKLDAPK